MKGEQEMEWWLSQVDADVFAETELIGQLHSAAGTFNQLKELIQ